MRNLFIFVLLLATTVTVRADEKDLVDFFESKVRPVLIQHCFACHSQQAKSIKGSLRLDSLEGMLRGGDSGAAITPGNPATSLILSALNYDDFKMPPKGQLQQSLRDNITKWIEDGAVVPDSFRSAAPVAKKKLDFQSARKHWAYQPLNATLPEVHDDKWPHNDIDTYILARLEQEGLTPPDQATAIQRLRRLSYTLTGLPPSLSHVQRHQEALSQQEYAKLADDLLATVQYGERWGRHWLDVARYADSNGADENKPYPLAWHYRNYVIDAFNRDTPFNDFIVEQLAGDLLPPSDDLARDNRHIIATTFLALGIKIDAEQDQEKKRADIIDEQIDTIGRTFLATTIACARCHDHKFDPIPTEDYYALAGVLRSTDLATRDLENPAASGILQNKREVEVKLSNLAREQGLKLGQEAIDHATRYFSVLPKAFRHWKTQIAPEVLINLDKANTNPASAAAIASDNAGDLITIIEAEQFDRGFAGIETDGYGEEIGIIADKGTDERIWVEYDYDATAAGTYQLEFRYAAKESRPATLSINGQQVSTNALAQTTGGWYPDNQKWHVSGRYELKEGINTIAFEVPRLMAHVDKVALARIDDFNLPLKEAEVFDAGNIKAFTSGDVTYISDPPTGQSTYFVEYKLTPRASGKQQLRIRYAALDSRPMRLFVDDKLIKEDAVSATTGGWTHQFQKWHDETELNLSAEPHRIRLEREGAVSHIDKIQLVSAKAGEPDSDLKVAIEQQMLNPHALQRWIETANTISKSNEPLARFLHGTADSLPEDLIAILTNTASSDLKDRINRRASRSELSEAALDEFDALDADLQEVNKQLSEAPKLQVMAVQDGETQDSPVFIRGNHLSHGDVVPRRFLQIVEGTDQAPYPKEASGRLRWAQSIASEENPLTARVIANRVWRWHFGRPLVDSTENFGLSGTRPSHPQLLDHLAEYLIKHNWSLKQLHRYIISSKTFQMSGEYSELNTAIDPGNLNYWRWQPRRLEAEAIRDSLLMISGKLDTQPSGEVLGGIATLSPSVDGLAGNRKIYETSQKRSVYLPVVRTNVFEMLTVFDFPNPAAPEGNRVTTTVPTQAMYLINNPVIHDYAQSLARLVMQHGGNSLEEQINWLFLRCYNRPPINAERASTRTFFLTADEATGDRPDNPLTAWTAVCHSMLIANEFIYLD
ncbi:MAG: DUF1553 domain-containing protein [Pirellulales bacterium]|nr:DUF1553 domain-containing protein [Pirellulales bacterium]